MSSQQNDDSSADEATSSLGDSTYDFIDDRSVVTTDEESQDDLTESIASSEGLETTGSLRNIHPRRTSCEEIPTLLNRSCYEHGDAPLSHNPQTPVLHPRDDIIADSEACNDRIIFDEPSVIEFKSPRALEASYTLQTVDSSEVLPSLRPTKKITANLRQSMGNHHANLGCASYRVLYVGDPEYKGVIVQKIATALAASHKTSTLGTWSPRTSKFNVVPISSFGDQSSPEVVLIDSSGVELEVEECKQANFFETPDGHDILQITLADGSTIKSARDGCTFGTSERWTLPNLAIFCASERDDIATKRSRRFAGMFMSRLKVPSLSITSTPQWKAPCETIPVNHLTPHICLEDLCGGFSRSRVLKRLPVDLSTFLRIDASQMSRNLAYIAPLDCSNENLQLDGKGETETKGDSNFLNTCWPRFLQPYGRFMHQFMDMSRIWCLVGLLASVLVIASIAGNGRAQLSSDGLFMPKMHNSTATRSPTASSLPTGTLASMASLTSCSTTSTPVQVKSEKHSSARTDIASLILDSTFGSPNWSEQFQVQVLGDRHIVMRPPHWLAKPKKAPLLSYRLTRKSSTLPFKLLDIFDGVYALEIPREEAYGTVAVEVWSESRPNKHESFEVDFGSYWLQIAAWKRATQILTKSFQTELFQLQTSLSASYGKSKAGISQMLRDKQSLLNQPHIFQRPLALHHWEYAIHHLLDQSRDLSARISKSLSSEKGITHALAKSWHKAFSADLKLYSQRKPAEILRQAQKMRRTVTGAGGKGLFDGLREQNLAQLHNVQKGILKTWWKFRGLPIPEARKLKKDPNLRAGDSPLLVN